MSDEVDGTARAAIDALVGAFAAHDTEAYFAAFADDATFVFHNHPDRLASRAQYREVWRSWERDGFRVLGCRSLEPLHTRVGDDVVVFTHRVRTRLAGTADEQRERETIVLHRGAADRWLAVHEHLSVDPTHEHGE